MRETRQTCPGPESVGRFHGHRETWGNGDTGIHWESTSSMPSISSSRSSSACGICEQLGIVATAGPTAKLGPTSKFGRLSS